MKTIQKKTNFSPMTAKLMSSVCVIKCGVDTIKKKIKKYTFLSRDDKPFQWKPVKIVWKD